MALFKIIPRLPSAGLTQVKQIHTAKFPLQFLATPSLWAEPLKAKKRLDPAIIKAREEKRKRKLEKLIRRRSKLEKNLKPVYENKLPYCLVDNPKERERTVNVPQDVIEERFKLLKTWTNIKREERKADMILINRLICVQEKALNELRLESEELYQAAIKIDENLIPFEFSGPVETPQLETYEIPDGEFIDVSKKW